MTSGGCPVHHHGVTQPLGCQHSGFGTFGRMFPDLAGLLFDDELLDLLGAPGGLMHDERRDSADSDLPAGYTFFAQFVDHDITLDTGSQLNAPGENEPEKVKNQRTPSLDLDCVYGLGPEATPMLYDGSRFGMLLDGSGEGRPWDLARSSSGAALIGDPRNDENLFVSQMQLLWIQFHNCLLLANPGIGHTAAARFERIQERVRHHYQAIILYDFLRRVCDRAVYDFAIERIEQAVTEQREALGAKNASELPPSYPMVFRQSGSGHAMPMPVEFSVAAYRFGHTTVRDRYPANAANLDIELFDERFGVEGFSAIPAELAVDWRFQLPVDPCLSPANAKAFDHLLPDELIRMPDPIVGRTSDRNRSLAFRNLARGRSFCLPSGEEVFRALADAGYPMGDPLDVGTLFDPKDFTGKTQAAEKAADEAKEGTPLFFYLLREGAIANEGQRLGPAGSAILMEVFGRMLVGCTTSLFFARNHETGDFEDFEPDPCVISNGCKQSNAEGQQLDLASIVGFVRASSQRIHAGAS